MIVFVNPVYCYFYHDVLALPTIFGYYKREDYEGIVVNVLASIRGIKNAVAGHKIREEGGCNAYVAIAE